MESSKLGKKIQDWAANLGFTLPDGSVPPPNHFALLTATPHRRQLWEALVESVQPRQKIEHMRKQILVAKVQERKKYKKTNGTTSKQITDRFDVWQKQNACEAELKEKSNGVIKFEKIIMTKASDSLFEVCKLSELEQMFEELTEKCVVLKLLMQRKKKMMEDFERRLLKVRTSNLEKPGAEEKSHSVENILLSAGDCKCLLTDNCNCEFLHKLKDVYASGMTQQHLWEEVIEWKRILLEKLSTFVTEMNSNEKNMLSEKEKEIEKVLNASITQLKQKTTEKSLQMIINSTKGKLLDEEVERLEESLVQEVSRAPHESTLNESFSFFISGDSSKPGRENANALESVKSYLNVLELQKYEEFLKEELQVVQEEMMKTKRRVEGSNGGEGGFHSALKEFDRVVDEINAILSEEEKLEKEIFRCHSRVEVLLRTLRDDMEVKAKSRAVEEAAEKLKMAWEKQIHLLLETPGDVFRTVESSSGRVLFECESASQFLINYGGELKQFFSAMLIPPVGTMEDILTEVKKRKRVLEEMRNVVSVREKLTGLQRELQHQLSSVNHDRHLCEKNFEDCDGILWNVVRKTDALLLEVDYIEKILSNWVEQPYRSMIKETAWGKGLKESEEKYAKGKNE